MLPSQSPADDHNAGNIVNAGGTPAGSAAPTGPAPVADMGKSLVPTVITPYNNMLQAVLPWLNSPATDHPLRPLPGVLLAVPRLPRPRRLLLVAPRLPGPPSLVRLPLLPRRAALSLASESKRSLLPPRMARIQMGPAAKHPRQRSTRLLAPTQVSRPRVRKRLKPAAEQPVQLRWPTALRPVAPVDGHPRTALQPPLPVPSRRVLLVPKEPAVRVRRMRPSLSCRGLHHPTRAGASSKTRPTS
ncbi:hypothetical protein V8F20_009716 [Naviculisporaceae sp. PSN 640]